MIKVISFCLLVIFSIGISACSTEEEQAFDDRPLGNSARSFLSDEQYTSLQVEIVYVTGYQPSSTSINNFKSFLEKHLNKPEGISIYLSEIASPGISTYSLEDIKQIENEHRTLYTTKTKLSSFVFIADDKSTVSTSKELILGKAYKNTAIVIFGKEIRTLAESAAVSSSQIQEVTIKHEFGHLFGLVDNGTPAQSNHVYKDPKNPGEKGHCTTPGCLMARDLNYRSSGDLHLKEHCTFDLVANGGK